MTPVTSVIIPVLTYDGTPPDSFGKDGQACIDTTNNLLFTKMAGTWGAGVPIANIESGTAQGQMIFWDATLGKWTNTETGELFWDDINKRIGIGTATPQGTFEVDSGSYKAYIQDGKFYAKQGVGSYRYMGSFGSNRMGTNTMWEMSAGAAADVYTSYFTSSDISIYPRESGKNILLNPTSGNVGIGTATPRRKLDSLNTTDPQIRWTYTDDVTYGELQVGSDGKTNLFTTGNEIIFSALATTQKPAISLSYSHAGVDANFDSTATVTAHSYSGSVDLLTMYTDGNGTDYLQALKPLYYPAMLANIYVHNNSTAQSIATGTTYTKSTAFDTNGPSKNITPDAANAKIPTQRTGFYEVFCTISAYSGTPNINLLGTIFWNGIEQNHIHYERYLSTSSDVGVMTFTGVVEATTANTDIDLRLRHDFGSAVNITIKYGNLLVKYAGDL